MALISGIIVWFTIMVKYEGFIFIERNGKIAFSGSSHNCVHTADAIVTDYSKLS